MNRRHGWDEGMDVNHMKEYLTQLARMGDLRGMPEGYCYSSLADFVLDRATGPGLGALTEEQFDYLCRVANATGLPFEPKQCFHNSSMLAILDRS